MLFAAERQLEMRMRKPSLVGSVPAIQKEEKKKLKNKSNENTKKAKCLSNCSCLKLPKLTKHHI